MEQIEHILFNPDWVTFQFTHFFNGGKLTIKRTVNTLIKYNQSVFNITFDCILMDKIEKIAKKINYELVIKGQEKRLINAQLIKRS